MEIVVFVILWRRMRMMPRTALSAMHDGARSTGVRRWSFFKEQCKTMVTWRVSLNTWLVKNLQYVLSTFELFPVLLAVTLLVSTVSWLLCFFSQSRQPSAAFSTCLCTWLRHVTLLSMALQIHKCKGQAMLSSPSFVVIPTSLCNAHIWYPARTWTQIDILSVTANWHS